MGLGLEPREVELVRDYVAAALPEVAIPASVLGEEPQLPRTDVPRTDIRPASPSEDPCNVFITRCHVEGPPGRALSGMRVGLKDHISVAGSSADVRLPVPRGLRADL